MKAEWFARRIDTPWRMLIVDNFLPEELYRSTVAEARSLHAAGCYEQTSAHPFKVTKTVAQCPSLYEFVMGPAVETLMTENFPGLRFDFDPRTAIQYRISNSSTPQIYPHWDGSESALERRQGVILYLNPEWNDECGGEFVAMRSAEPDPESDLWLKPLSNRALFWIDGPAHIHRVQPVRKGYRYSMVAEWKVKHDGDAQVLA